MALLTVVAGPWDLRVKEHRKMSSTAAVLHPGWTETAAWQDPHCAPRRQRRGRRPGCRKQRSSKRHGNELPGAATVSATAASKRRTEFIQRFLPRELYIVKCLDHKNIIRVYETLESSDGKIYMVMELADGGDVFDSVSQDGPMPENRAKILFRQLVDAISYLHSRGVAHRDLKCENALLHKGLNLKLTDFGFAKLVPTSSADLSRTFCGSTAYAAPEVLQGVPHDSRKGDIWGMGVVLYVMLCATLPFDDTDIPEMLWKQQKGISIPSSIRVSQECQDLLRRLLDPDMHQRPSIEEVSSHAWVVNL